MKSNSHSFIVRLIQDQRAQMLPVMALMVIVFMGIVALSVSVGSTYTQQHALQSATNAAALAGAQALPNATAATAAASYASSSGEENINGTLKNVSMVSGYPKLECLTTLTNMGIVCVAPANANAIQVKQQLTVPIIFGGLFGGKSTTTLTATATAAARGTGNTVSPYNVAIIADATASMSTTDSDSLCNSTRMSCALQGIRVLMQALSPCSGALSSCGTVTAGTLGTGNVAGSVDRIALFQFPNVSTSNVADAYDCSSTNATTEDYTFPTAGATSYTPLSSATYEDVGFSSDYKTSDTATTLNTSSTNNNLVKASGGKSGCSAMGDPGGAGTYLASAIYAAQSALVAEQAAFPGSQNVLIIISDGDASSTNMGSATSSTTYPGTKQQCAQAVTAGQNVAKANAYGNGAIPTRVYSVAYGAAASGCSKDTSPTITPCHTMQGIASAPQNFFSDYTASQNSGACISASRPTTGLTQIFTIIAGDLTVAHLISNSTT
jgi:hypothetical protein